MAINQIQFMNDPYGNINIQIDGETISLDIKEIQKAETHFELNKPLNTILYNDIILDATLYENNDIIKEGNVTASIWNKEKTIKYYETALSIIDKHISAIIPNNLKIGEYILTLNYNGAKYFRPKTSNFLFTIDKRTLLCYFDKTIYYGDPDTSVNVQGVIRDKDNKKIIPNCPLKYQFNSRMYDILTDGSGRFSINVTVPSTDISHCKSVQMGEMLSFNDVNYLGYKSENSYRKISYPLCVCSVRDNYILKPTQVYITANKLPTAINVNLECDDITNNLTIRGDVEVDTGSSFKYARYGYVDVHLLNDAYTIRLNVDDSGDFGDLVRIIDIVDSIENDEEYVVQTDTNKTLSTQINTSTTQTSLHIGDTINYKAQVFTVNGKVTDGMVAFSLYNSDDRQVYRYVSKLDENGEAEFIFYTSKADTYTIEVNYYGIGRYQDSTNNEDIIFEVV